MKKLLLALVLCLFASSAFGAITVVGEAFSSADNVDGTADTVAITYPGSMAFGDLIVVHLMTRNSSVVSFSLDDAAGQNWKRTARITNTNNSQYIVWAVYSGSAGDGTVNWTIDTSDGNVGGWMVVFHNTDKNAPWDVFPTVTTIAALQTWPSTDYSTLTSGAVAIMSGCSGDDNTWTIDNTFVAPVSALYWRNTLGADSSVFFAIKTIASPGAVGVTTATQATLFSDSGIYWWGSVRQVGSVRRGLLM